MKYTKDDIKRLIEEEDVEFIRLQFTEIFGTLKNVAITASQIDRALDNQIMFDGSSIEGFARIEESDMFLYFFRKEFRKSFDIFYSNQIQNLYNIEMLFLCLYFLIVFLID